MKLLKQEVGEKSTVKIEFSVDKEVFDKAVEKVYRRQVKKINVPGFRAGKAPRAIIEKMYGSGVFYEDAINDLIPENYTEAVKEAGIEPVGQPEIDIVSIDENGLVLSAIVPVKPECTLEGYKGIEIAKAEGKYKGRKPVAVDEAKFRAVCARWRAGEITATAAMQEVGLKPNTFYRRVKELGL